MLLTALSSLAARVEADLPPAPKFRTLLLLEEACFRFLAAIVFRPENDGRYGCLQCTNFLYFRLPRRFDLFLIPRQTIVTQFVTDFDEPPIFPRNVGFYFH